MLVTMVLSVWLGMREHLFDNLLPKCVEVNRLYNHPILEHHSFSALKANVTGNCYDLCLCMRHLQMPKLPSSWHSKFKKNVNQELETWSLLGKNTNKNLTCSTCCSSRWVDQHNQFFHVTVNSSIVFLICSISNLCCPSSHMDTLASLLCGDIKGIWINPSGVNEISLQGWLNGCQLNERTRLMLLYTNLWMHPPLCMTSLVDSCLLFA